MTKTSGRDAFIDLTAVRFGRWLVLNRVPPTRETNWKTVWLCRCDCGTERVVASWTLRRGISSSCGCAITTHNSRHTRLYAVWQNMLNRCRNPNIPAFKHYGGRGISVCAEWLDFKSFQDWATESGYSDDLTIERDDVNGNYCPDNCSWITKSEQAINRRVARRDESGRPWLETAMANGIDSNDFNRRVRRGWSEKDAATIPLGATRHLPKRERPGASKAEASGT